MKIRISILLAGILLVAGCVGLRNQTSESEPHALVVIAPDTGSREQPVVIKIDGRKVKPGAEYRVSPGEHGVIVMTMVQIDETFGTSKIIGVGNTGQSAATLTLPQAGDPEVSGNTPPPFGLAVQPVNLRAEGWAASYITNSIMFEAGWRYVLDGEQVGKMHLPRMMDGARGKDGTALNESDEKGFTPLNQAAYKGDVTMVKWLLDAGADPDLADNEGFTPLHTAVEHQHLNVVKTLLDHDADPNKGCPNGRSPLHQAAALNDLESLRVLLEAGAAVDAVCPGGTPLASAAQNNDKDAVRTLLEHGAGLDVAYKKTGLTPLHWAALLGHGEIAAILLEAGADINNMSPDHGTPLHSASFGRQAAHRFMQQGLEKISSGKAITPLVGSDDDYAALWDVLLAAKPNLELREPKYGRTALGNAANQGSETAVDALIAAGADVNAASRYGQTPLHEAAAIKESVALSNIVVHLIDAGAEIEARDGPGGTPLHATANYGKPVMIQLLLDAGSDVNSAGPKRCPPLFFAVMKGDQASVRLLLDAGAKVDLPNSIGSSALLQAVVKQKHEIISMLLDHGADPNAGSADNTTALIVSADNGDMETMKLLLEHGAEVNAINKRGVTALLAAVAKGRLEAARLLIAHGAKNEAMEKDGTTPLIQAARGGYLELVGFLLDKGASVDAANQFGFTALQEASDQAHADVVELLLNQGADPNRRDDHGAAPLHVAANGMFSKEERYVAVIKVLLAHGADINARARGDNQQTPLHRSAEWGRPEIMQALIDAGADLSIRDSNGKTALDIACDSFDPRLRREVADRRKTCEKLLCKAMELDAASTP